MNSANRIFTDEIKRLLEKSGIAPSYQRIKIYEYLYNHRTHPTADMVYGDLIGEMPTLSKTTVYNTLNILADAGMAKRIFIEGCIVRFDAEISPHMHFKCTKCKEVYDIFSPAPKVKSGEHKIEGEEVYLYGICKKCKEE